MVVSLPIARVRVGLAGGKRQDMSGVTGMAALGVGLLCACGIASAACDTSSFDRTPPPAIRADPATATLEWASDVDNLNGQLWIWHYVKNTRPQPLGLRWVKANIRRHLGNPLPPGETDCNRFFANAVNDTPDDDAPIIYGTNEQRQDAAVFVRRAAPQGNLQKGETISVIDTSFAAGGKVEDVHVVVASRRTEKGLVFQLEQPANVVIAMSSLAATFSAEQFSVLSRGLDAPIAPANFQQYTKLDAAKALGGLFSDKELAERVKQEYVFFPPARKAAIEIPTVGVQQVSADLIILDRQLQPQFATEIIVLVPAAAK